MIEASPLLTQWPPPTSWWSCLWRQTLCGHHLAWWLQTIHCDRGLDDTIKSLVLQLVLIILIIRFFIISAVNSINISYHALFGRTQTPESPKVWCSCQLNMKPAAFPTGQRRCPAQSLCGPSGFVQSPRPHSPTPKIRHRQPHSARLFSLILLRIKQNCIPSLKIKGV